MIEQIRAKAAAGQFEFSQHAVDQAIIRHITVSEIGEAFAAAEIIGDYPGDKYGQAACCLDSPAVTGRFTCWQAIPAVRC